MWWQATRVGRRHSLEPSKIVVRYKNGKLVKGFTQNFFPNKPVFHVLPVEGSGLKEPLEVSMDQLKAVFFVRDFTGNKAYQERKHLIPGEKPLGRLIEATCEDGEVLVGTTTGYDPKRAGFFIFPVDPGGNNLKAYIVVSSLRKVRQL
jgi:hypothetical protein